MSISKRSADNILLLDDFPKLKPVIDRVQMVNAEIASADLVDVRVEEGRGSLSLRIDLSWGAGGTVFDFSTAKRIQQVLSIVGVTRLSQLPGKYVRVEYMSQASWIAFLRIWNLNKDQSLLVTYDKSGLDRYAAGRPV